MALRTLSARHFNARTFLPISGYQVTVIPLPEIPFFSSSGGSHFYDLTKKHLTQNKIPSEDDLILLIAFTALNFLES
jgi:hypothetical protein